MSRLGLRKGDRRLFHRMSMLQSILLLNQLSCSRPQNRIAIDFSPRLAAPAYQTVRNLGYIKSSHTGTVITQLPPLRARSMMASPSKRPVC